MTPVRQRRPLILEDEDTRGSACLREDGWKDGRAKGQRDGKGPGCIRSRLDGWLQDVMICDLGLQGCRRGRLTEPIIIVLRILISLQIHPLSEDE
nr:hypothetical protein CFP56_77527 [Quercus suber]